MRELVQIVNVQIGNNHEKLQEVRQDSRCRRNQVGDTPTTPRQNQH